MSEKPGVARTRKPIVNQVASSIKPRTFGTAKRKIKLTKKFDTAVPGFEQFYR
jgi:hypothetical protein